MINTDKYLRLIRAKEFIDDSFYKPIDLNSIAREAYFSPFHFLRLFREVYNKTPHTYMRELRIDRAKDLLRMDSHSVTDICFEVGFESPGSFSTLFNKLVGMPPTKYREENLRRVLLSVNFPEKLIPACFLFFR